MEGEKIITLEEQVALIVRKELEEHKEQLINHINSKLDPIETILQELKDGIL